MTELSEESLFLLKNWDTVEDILEAVQRLQKEFSQILYSVEADLAQEEWWTEGWVFIAQTTQVYISNRSWLAGDNYAIWIGVEQFTPGKLFGTDSGTQLYVWTADRRYDLAQQLAEWLQAEEDELLGEIDRRARGYVVREPFRAFMPQEADQVVEVARKQILDFFRYYARTLWAHDSAIRDFLGLQ